MLTQARLKELLHYDPETGVFTWLVRRGPMAAGSVAGSAYLKRKDGDLYITITVDGHCFQNAARLAWLYMTGIIPVEQVDHKNRQPLDNRWRNLRLATPGQNQANKGVRKDNTSGYVGVAFIPEKGKWRARLSVDGRHKYLGYFPDPEQASAAYRKAISAIRGEFAVLA